MTRKTKRNFIELIQEVNEDGEVTKSAIHLTPAFIPYPKYLDLMDRISKVEKDEDIDEIERIDKFMEIIVEIYGEKFTVDELKAGLHAPEANQILQDQVRFVSEGVVAEENEAKLKELLKK